MNIDIPAIVPLLLVSAGLAAIYARLRLDFDRALSLLVVVLLATATPLYATVARAPHWPGALAFGGVAVLLWTGVLARSRLERFGAAALVLVLPSLAALAAGRIAFPSPMLALFGPADGVLALTPILYLGAVGLIGTARRHPGEAALGVAALFIWTLTGAPLTGAAAILAAGLARALDWLRQRPLGAVAALAVAAIWWNHLLMVQYAADLLPKDEPVSFARLVRQQADVQTRPPYTFPLAFPANVLFAWRSGLPLHRYDDLAPVSVDQRFELRMDRSADRFLLEGWEAPGMDGDQPVWWMGARRAEIAVPLAQVPGALDIDITARARLDAPALDADLVVELNGFEVERFIAASASPTERRVRLPAATAKRVLRAGYNRLAIVNHGTLRADPSDTRPPGPLAERRRGRAWPVAIYRVRLAPAHD